MMLFEALAILGEQRLKVAQAGPEPEGRVELLSARQGGEQRQGQEGQAPPPAASPLGSMGASMKRAATERGSLGYCRYLHLITMLRSIGLQEDWNP
jgi:hypothetical protein